jgi:hypothetical protein
MIFRLYWRTRTTAKNPVLYIRAKFETRLYPLVLCFGHGGLKTSGGGRTVRPQLLQIDGRYNDLHVVKTELGALSNNFAYRIEAQLAHFSTLKGIGTFRVSRCLQLSTDKLKYIDPALPTVYYYHGTAIEKQAV